MKEEGFFELEQLLEKGLTPWHAVEYISRELESAGFPAEEPRKSGRPFHFIPYPGVLAAVRPGTQPLPESGLVLALSHLDSPSLKIKRHPDCFEGLQRYLVESYGSPSLQRFLDVPLKMAGRIFCRQGEKIGQVLFASEKKGIVPSLAPHLDREQKELNLQSHMPVVWSLDKMELEKVLGEETGTEPGDILSFDAFLVPAGRAQTLGYRDELLYSPRLDDLACVYASLQGLLQAGRSRSWQVVLLCNHEETGSLSREGAFSGLMGKILEKLLQSSGKSREEIPALAENSVLLSLDMAQGYHPGYPEAFDERNTPRLGEGPAVKLAASGRYASDAYEEAFIRKIAREHGISLQTYQSRSDRKGGTTLGPLAGAFSGMRALDAGIPMLGMHSAGELTAREDIQKLKNLLKYYFMERF